MKFFKIENLPQPWGDYGEILWSGMTCNLPRENATLHLERTGPFIPPVFISGISDIIVKDSVKLELEKHGLVGLDFQEVKKAKIVQLEWEHWDKSLEEPPEIPESGEPEDYILSKPNDAELAESIGKLWEICANGIADVKLSRKLVFFGEPAIYLKLDSWGGQDIFSSKSLGYKFVTQRAKEAFEQIAPGALIFEQINVI